MANHPTFFPTAAEFRRWLEANYATTPELLVGFWKKSTGMPSIDWPQAPPVPLRRQGSRPVLEL